MQLLVFCIYNLNIRVQMHDKIIKYIKETDKQPLRRRV